MSAEPVDVIDMSGKRVDFRLNFEHEFRMCRSARQVSVNREPVEQRVSKDRPLPILRAVVEGILATMGQPFDNAISICMFEN